MDMLVGVPMHLTPCKKIPTFLATSTGPPSYALLKLDEKPPFCKNLSANFLHEERRHHDNPGGPDWVRAPAATVIYCHQSAHQAREVRDDQQDDHSHTGS